MAEHGITLRHGEHKGRLLRPARVYGKNNGYNTAIFSDDGGKTWQSSKPFPMTGTGEGAVARRIKAARFPVIKTLDSFRWDWPQKINRLQVQDLFRLDFIKDHANVIFLGLVGLGKTHLATALGHAACQKRLSVRFATAIDVVNTLHAAQQNGTLKRELRSFTSPVLLILDELGYLPIDQRGADLLFQVISARYERGSIVLTTNKAFKHWPTIFNNDSTIASAVLDRLLHHAHTVVIEGQSFRMKDRIDA